MTTTSTMTKSEQSEDSEARGMILLPVMMIAAGLVLAVVFGLTYHPEAWLTAFGAVLLTAVIIGGVRWIMPILADGEGDALPHPAH
ncbi:hypothetical protein [Conexibacter sp. DBS9H8]|uniref:hypothetical protein n=1 Tax=Conexibacter sp. DBS9H8 TaxID=2937801 RepID=UPI00200FAC44|nr:hypothetical protein [Conexibacter sp. DBS9H8]